MIGDLTLEQLRTRMDEHLMAVEEVLGGLDLSIRQLESRLTHIEEILGLEPDGLSATGALADLSRLGVLIDRMRQEGR